MELELDICFMLLGPWMRAACTPSLFADGERRFVVEEAGPGAMCNGVLMAGYREGGLRGNDPLHCGRNMGRERGRGREREEGRNDWRWLFGIRRSGEDPSLC